MAETRILVPIDGSDSALAALAKAAEVATAQHAVLDLLYVLDTRQFEVSFSQGIDGKVLYNAEQRAEVQLKDWAKPYQDAGLDVHIHLRFGSPRTVVALDAPKDYHSSMIILGRSSKKLAARMFIGSVASFVVENAPCDVLIISAN